MVDAARSQAEIERSVREAGQLVELGEIARAVPIIQKVLKHERGHVEARALLGYCALKEGDLGTAEQNLRFALKKKPEQPFASYALGLTLWKQGKTADAVQMLQQVVDRAPGFEDAQRALRDIRSAQTRSVDRDQTEPSPRPASPTPRHPEEPSLSPRSAVARFFLFLVRAGALVGSLVFAFVALDMFVKVGANDQFPLAAGLAGLFAVLFFVSLRWGRGVSEVLNGQARRVSLRSEPVGFRGSVRILTFRLYRSNDAAEHPIAMEMRGNSLSGRINEGDRVSIAGRRDRDHIFRVKLIKNLETGEFVRASRNWTIGEMIPTLIFIAVCSVILYLIFF